MLPIKSAIEVKSGMDASLVNVYKLALVMNVFISAVNYFKGKTNSYS